MGFFGNIMQSFSNSWQAGIYAARRVFEDPSTAHQQEMFAQRSSEFMLLWAYYNSSMFDKTARWLNSGSWQNNAFWPASGGWQLYKSNYNLYRNIRMIYNPVRRLVDSYAGWIYPGVLSEDGDDLPDGVQLAIPFSDDTDPALKMAIAQFWQWSNWQAKKSVLVRYGAALGSVLIEAIDDVERGKIYGEIQWPGFVRHLSLDAAGNVKAYSLQYSVWNLDEGSYLYRKDVDQDQICYYRNDEPYDYGYGAIVENIYGFVPAVWIKHIDVGADYGSPSIAGSFGKIDELNNLASHAHDQIHKIIGAPAVIWSDAPISNLFGKESKNRGTTTDFEKPAQEQENVLMLKGPSGGSLSSLAGNLSLSDTKEYMVNLLSEIESDHPELTFYQQLRTMSQVTGPGANRMMGDVESRVVECQANYDQAMIKLFQMSVAIGGMRANSGAWGTLNRQQQKFKPFGLDSYARGDLDMAIMPRPLLMPTKKEIAEEKQSMWLGVQAAVTAGAPLELVLRDEGWSDDALAALGQAKADAIMRDQMTQQEDVEPAQEQ
jgi:hypothetical protein